MGCRWALVWCEMGGVCAKCVVACGNWVVYTHILVYIHTRVHIHIYNMIIYIYIIYNTHAAGAGDPGVGGRDAHHGADTHGPPVCLRPGCVCVCGGVGGWVGMWVFGCVCV
jgi:hypothetical protein